MYLKEGVRAEAGLKYLGSPAGGITAYALQEWGLFLSKGLFFPNRLSLPNVITTHIAAYGAVWLCHAEGVQLSSVLGISTVSSKPNLHCTDYTRVGTRKED